MRIYSHFLTELLDTRYPSMGYLVSNKSYSTILIIMLFLLIPILISSAGQILLKRGMLELGSLEFSFSNFFYLILRIFKNKWLIAGIISYGMSFFFYLFALSYLQLNIAYPVAVSCGIILVSLFSRLFFKESITLYQISGIFIIIFGIALLANR